ncbi:Protein crumbs 1 [Liparis tanakae]|uniref:Protein crumbs 1 n=1 Tax=Liparis tanakae TaxID=230148 RepID=A0A4Z2ER08_9TELE|nr:Protein crumbs 1 [Liparis tanakae]
MGRLFVRSLPRGAALSAPVFLTTGEKQLLQVEVRGGRVTFERAGLRYDIGDVPEVAARAGDRAYVGGLPGGWDAGAWGGRYKGCLQDLRLDSLRLDPGARNRSDQQGAPYAQSVEEGCVSDDACKVEPCLNGGRCTVTFNDFSCSCPAQFTGKTCGTRVWCVGRPCEPGGHCLDLPDGYECKRLH